MKLVDLTHDIAKTFVCNNHINGAFIWRNKDKGWDVFIGDIDNVTGWKEETFSTKRNAVKYCNELNRLIVELTTNKGG